MQAATKKRSHELTEHLWGFDGRYIQRASVRLLMSSNFVIWSIFAQLGAVIKVGCTLHEKAPEMCQCASLLWNHASLYERLICLKFHQVSEKALTLEVSFRELLTSTVLRRFRRRSTCTPYTHNAELIAVNLYTYESTVMPVMLSSTA